VLAAQNEKKLTLSESSKTLNILAEQQSLNFQQKRYVIPLKLVIIFSKQTYSRILKANFS